MEHTLKRLLLFLSLGVAAWAGIGACNNATEFPTQPPSMATIDAPGGSYSAGCTAVDKTFTNFSYNTGSPTYEGDSYLGWGCLSCATVASPFGSGTTPADTAVEFLPGGSYWYASANGGYAYDTVTFSYTVQSGTTMYEAGLSYTGSYTAYSGGPYEGYEYVQLSICPGLTTFVVNCAGEQTTGGGILSFTPTAVIGVQETVYFYAESESGYGAYAEVNSIENDFYDAPEPSTFSLLAIGLGAGWLLRRRRALRHSQLTSSIREEL